MVSFLKESGTKITDGRQLQVILGQDKVTIFTHNYSLSLKSDHFHSCLFFDSEIHSKFVLSKTHRYE
jgi:hypothetical protein